MHDAPANTGLTGFARRLEDAHAPDADLLQRYVESRDEVAFAALVRRHGPAVWRVCRAVARQTADAEDAFQATLLLLMRNAGRVRNPAAVGAWLHGTAVRVATKARARRRPDPLASEPAAPFDDLTVREAEALVHEELANLPARFRDPLLLCCLDGLARDEAAERLGVSVGAVKHGIERGRELLRARLLQRGVTVGVPLLAVLLGPPARAAVPAFRISTASAGAVTLSREVGMAFSAKWAWAVAAGLSLLIVAAGLSVSAPGGGPLPAAVDPPRPNPPGGVGRKQAGGHVTEIALPGSLFRATTSRDGKVVATVTEEERDGEKFAVVNCWDTATGKQLGTLGGVKNYNPLSIALSPDGSAFAWIHREKVEDDDIAIQVFDVKTGKQRCVAGQISVRPTGYPDLQFSPDGKRLAASSTFDPPNALTDPFIGGAVVLDAERGGVVHTFRGHIGIGNRNSCPVFAYGGKLLATVGIVDDDNKVILWNLEKGVRERSFDLTESERVHTNAITPDGEKLVTFHVKGQVKVWDIGSGKCEVTMAEPGDEPLHTGAVAVSPDGRRAAAVVMDTPTRKPKLKVWDLKSGKLLLTVENVWPQTCCFDAAGRVAVSDDKLKKLVFHSVPE